MKTFATAVAAISVLFASATATASPTTYKEIVAANRALSCHTRVLNAAHLLGMVVVMQRTCQKTTGRKCEEWNAEIKLFTLMTVEATIACPSHGVALYN